MADSDEEKNQKNDADQKFESMVPQFKLRNNDMGLKALKWAAICKVFNENLFKMPLKDLKNLIWIKMLLYIQ